MPSLLNARDRASYLLGISSVRAASPRTISGGPYTLRSFSTVIVYRMGDIFLVKAPYLYGNTFHTKRHIAAVITVLRESGWERTNYENGFYVYVPREGDIPF